MSNPSAKARDSRVRFTVSDLEYEDPGAGLPETLIWKTVSGDARTRDFLTTLGVYEREARFYGQLADGLRIAPRPYFSRFDTEEGTFCLIIEDVSYMNAGRPGRGMYI